MKKLIFLLLMAVALVGFVSAGAVYPPGVITLEAALFGNSIDGYAVIPDTVLVMVMPVVAGPTGLQAVMVYDNFIAIQPQSGITNISNMPSGFRQACAISAPADYYLRC